MVDGSSPTSEQDLDPTWSPLSPLSDTGSRGSTGSVNSWKPEELHDDVRRGMRPMGKQTSTGASGAFRLEGSQRSSSQPLSPTPSLSSISTDDESFLESPTTEEVIVPIPRKDAMRDAPTGEPLEMEIIDISFYSSLSDIIKSFDRTFTPSLSADAFSKYVSEEDVLGVLVDRSKEIEHCHGIIDKMLDTLGQKSNDLTRKSIREAVAEWVDWAFRLQVANLARVKIFGGVSKSPGELEKMFRNLLADPFSLAHHRIDNYAYVEVHKYIALFLQKLVAHLRDEKTRFEELVKKHGLPGGSKFSSFLYFMMRDIVILWNFLETISFSSTLAHMFHQTHPDLFSLGFRKIFIKLMANFDFLATFRDSKLELTRIAKKRFGSFEDVY